MKTMQRNTTTPPMVIDEVGPLKRKNRLLTWLSIALAAALVAFGALVYIDSGDTTNDLTAEQEQMLETIDAYRVAWNDHDGPAAAALMASDDSYHDNGTRYLVAEGRLENLISGLGGLSFSVRSLASDGEAAFVGNYVLTTDFIPASSTIARPSFFKMTPDGTAIIWHYAP